MGNSEKTRSTTALISPVVRRKTGEDRRSEILETARDIIYQSGFSSFTVRIVASHVGISEAAIYRHFSSKEEMLLGLLDYLFEPWRAEIEKMLRGKRPGIEKLQQLQKLHLHHLLEKRLNPMLFFSESISPENGKLLDKMRCNLLFLQQSIAAIIRMGIDDGSIRGNIALNETVAAVTGILQTSIVRWTLFRSDDGLREYAGANMRFFAGLIAGDGFKEACADEK
jgi:AcrR family transcriptional regulator